MKKTFLWFVLFLMGLVAIDFLSGLVSKPLLLDEPDAGSNHSNFKQSLYDKDADILLLGASKANHHYINDSLEQHFRMSVFNCGIDGDNIVTSRTQFDAMKERRLPKMVILDLSGGQLGSDWESVFLTHKVYEGIEPHYTSVAKEYLSTKRRIMLLSSLYKLNEEIPDLLLSYIQGQNGNNGFSPLLGTNANISHITKTDKKPYVIGEVQRDNLDYIVSCCKEHSIKLVVVYSPTLITYNNGVTQSFADYCSENNVPFFNYESDTLYTNHPEYFKDYNHLNIIGAKVFTKDIINKIESSIHE